MIIISRVPSSLVERISDRTASSSITVPKFLIMSTSAWARPSICSMSVRRGSAQVTIAILGAGGFPRLESKPWAMVALALSASSMILMTLSPSPRAWAGTRLRVTPGVGPSRPRKSLAGTPGLPGGSGPATTGRAAATGQGTAGVCHGFSGFAGLVALGEQVALRGAEGGFVAAAAAQDERDGDGDRGAGDWPGEVDPVAGEGPADQVGPEGAGWVH